MNFIVMIDLNLNDRIGIDSSYKEVNKINSNQSLDSEDSEFRDDLI
jgi:hypothetical protein